MDRLVYIAANNSIITLPYAILEYNLSNIIIYEKYKIEVAACTIRFTAAMMGHPFALFPLQWLCRSRSKVRLLAHFRSFLPFEKDSWPDTSSGQLSFILPLFYP